MLYKLLIFVVSAKLRGNWNLTTSDAQNDHWQILLDLIFEPMTSSDARNEPFKIKAQSQ